MAARSPHGDSLALTRFIEALNAVISKGIETNMASIYNRLGINPGRDIHDFSRDELERYTGMLESAAAGRGFAVGF